MQSLRIFGLLLDACEGMWRVHRMNSRSNKTRPSGLCRIVLAGGPGGGKTTAGDLFRREMDADRDERSVDREALMRVMKRT